MEESRVVRETVEYENGDIEERILRRKEEPEKEYEAPGPSWLMPLGLLVAGGFALYLLYTNRDKVGSLLALMIPTAPAAAKSVETSRPEDEKEAAPPGGYSTPPTKYAAETPRPEVNVDEMVGLVERNGRMIG